jgi:hypothetical protein
MADLPPAFQGLDLAVARFAPTEANRTVGVTLAMAARNHHGPRVELGPRDVPRVVRGVEGHLEAAGGQVQQVRAGCNRHDAVSLVDDLNGAE